ncbi:outer membrane lipoprotein carrier protein LolA [Saccharospirillum sp. MSK14-1]|uniref:outer membrane lipoprotein chaperone LolA n=1 Tax=Saccharospirillum sp. MSK14-1 TaxID=1897632 RepID=UPI000D40B7F1|nr:outer membrane lipoprotein chaperone LolA [Saccharospirillum sp. MSK14-1]PTY36565.1 outer membrane lipoprotein carrier protein LolA [Saccharospirillum sp. MSK14-1]
MKVVLALLLAAASTLALADEAARARLIERLEATSNLSAQFEQETYAEGELRGDRSRGLMQIARPLRFVWQVSEPYEQSVISDGETLWVYDPDLAQATYQPVADQIRQSPAMILTQPRSTLSSSYEVAEASNEELTSYQLYPTDENAVFSELTLVFIDGVISQLRLTDNLGQDTRIRFSDVRTGVNFPDQTFEFEPPAGTDVFEQM